jgi:PhzF family phenazine biosynthesis protein
MGGAEEISGDCCHVGVRPLRINPPKRSGNATEGVLSRILGHVSRAAVNRVAVERTALRAFFASAGLSELPVFVFSLERGDDDATAFSRMFAPVFGVPEDPATGGAGGPLGGYLVHHGAVGADTASHIVSLQGVAMGRPSRIHISLAAPSGSITGVRVGGSAVLVGTGSIAAVPGISDSTR